MRARSIAAASVFMLVAGVMSYQAATATPPQPYVRLVHDGRPLAPWVRVECRSGERYSVYTTSDGREYDQSLNESCEAARGQSDRLAD